MRIVIKENCMFIPHRNVDDIHTLLKNAQINLRTFAKSFFFIIKIWIHGENLKNS